MRRKPVVTMTETNNKHHLPQHNFIPHEQGDVLNIALLLVLYTLQGIPMGLAGSLPVILKERGIGFADLALLSLASLPFSLKLLWAPLVDSVFIKSIGRRKSWLIPVQFLTGVCFLFGSRLVNGWMGDTGNPNVKALTTFFVCLYFLMATQDIAVDGWALTMLSRENVGYASICNSIGQSVGVFLSNQGFIALNDANWCHRFLGTEKGRSLVDLSQFMHFWGWVFIVVNLCIWGFKREKEIPAGHEPDGLTETYSHIVSVFRLRPIQSLTLALLTAKIAFGPADSVWSFKLLESGLSKADLATISPLLLLIGLVLPALVSGSVASNPMRVFRIGYPLKLFTSLLAWVSVNVCRQAFRSPIAPSFWFYAPLTLLMALHEVAGVLVFVSMMSFFAKKADPSIGGTYMTLLNTISNLGFKWVSTFSLWSLSRLTLHSCFSSDHKPLALECAASDACELAGGTCRSHLDGFTIQTAVALVFGVGWLLVCGPLLQRLEALPPSEWFIKERSDVPEGGAKQV